MTRPRRRDGYVSLECSPYLANDTEATVAEARRLWKAVGRPNLMVKVPGTQAGLPAIRQLIAAGHQHQRHPAVLASTSTTQVAEAYIAGAGRPAGAGRRCRARRQRRQLLRQPHRHGGRQADSTRSADKRRGAEGLRGKVAIANAKRRLPALPRLFAGPRWQALARRAREAAAPAVGLHRRQGSRLPRHALCRRADRRGHGQHHAAGDHGRVPRPRRSRVQFHRARNFRASGATGRS